MKKDFNLRKFIATTIREYLNEQQELYSESEIIADLKNNKLLRKYLTGGFIGSDNTNLINSINYLIPLRNKYPKILKPKSKVFYRTDTIPRTPELEQMIINDAYPVRDKPYIRHLSRLNADLLRGIKYQPQNKLQGWTSDEDFVWEHWYNVYIQNQGGDYVFDNENYFSCVYILNNTTNFLFNETFLDELRMDFGGNGEEFESLRIGGSVVCDVIIMNDL